ncbi:MAG TPA: hypothetical protein VNK04_19375 [Gemmataceae bacterium]|nr:hypothetical protein [Gemmataceae bacterium]
MLRAPRIAISLTPLLGLLVTAPLLAEPPALPSSPPAGEKKEAAKPLELKKPAPTKFVRLVRDDRGEPVALETAIVRYVPASGEGGVVVDLISVVHIGERAYYRKLNRHMEQYDALLYELVAPPGTRIPKGGRRDSDNPIALLQQLAKTVLNLELQTDHIDYTKKNFVHADLSPEGMAEAMRHRGEDGLTLALGIAADLLRQYNLQEMKRQKEPPKEADFDFDPLALLFDPAAPVKLKRLLAQQLEEMENPEAGLGQTLTTILIADRNKAAMQVFQKELAKGKKKIGIFYGAGHMPDFEKRLRDEFDLKKESEQWLQAWDLRLRR